MWWWVRRWPSASQEGTELANDLILTSQVPELWEISYLRHPVYDILLYQPKQTNTDSKTKDNKRSKMTLRKIRYLKTLFYFWSALLSSYFTNWAQTIVFQQSFLALSKIVNLLPWHGCLQTLFCIFLLLHLFLLHFVILIDSLNSFEINQIPQLI